ncbi:hypothetical protein [Gymnodinialimonas sp.]
MTSGFSGLDYWRLSDELTLVDATFLAIGLEPGDFELVSPHSPHLSEIRVVTGFHKDDIDRYENEDREFLLVPGDFRAVFKALRQAVISNKLRARIVNWARKPERKHFAGDSFIIPALGDEDERNYGFALSRGIPTVFSNADSILTTGPLDERTLYILKEPDWMRTTIELDDLKSWFKSRNFFPPFFFPDGAADGFRDVSHPRYSPKLSAAVAAWEAVKRPAPKKSPKQSLIDWIVSNGVAHGLGNERQVVSPTVADEVAKIANWQTAGGATPTHSGLEEPDLSSDEPIQNFEQVAGPDKSGGFGSGLDIDDDGSEIPF